MLKIYYNPKCKRSRSGLEYLNRKGIKPEIIEYLKNPITPGELKEIIMKLNLKPRDIVRTQEEYYKKELKGRNFTSEEWLKILIENPKLIQRPIIAGKYKAIIGTDNQLIDQFIANEKS